ncbi:MAG: tetratricopeptide repeat protein [Limnoraphis robusta]|uniref:tetratricopeptide repeat protein n=1 Tax=Limnoraphis robusta TaxID=1118279 RepID=UPI00066C81DE|nr:tetratricopeptide repeat protein [Limnoraphis robusta]
MKPIKFWNKLRSKLTTVFGIFVKQRFHRRSTGIAILLFIFSLSFSPIIARSQSHPDIVFFNSYPEVAQVYEPNLVEQAKSFYTQQQFDQAAVAWKQAVIFFAEQKDPLNQAIALSNLSLTYQQLGRWNEATQAINRSLDLLQRLEKNQETAPVLAQTLDIQGSLELAKGNPQAALDAWKRAFKIYQDTGNLTHITQNQINQAQAWQTLGRYNRAEEILEQTAKHLESQPYSAEKAIAFVSLGDIFRVIGNPDESQIYLENGQEIAKKLNLPEVQAAALMSLGNFTRSQNRFNDPELNQKAQKYYQDALEIAAYKTTQIQAQLNQLNLSVVTQDWNKVNDLQAIIRQQLKQVPQNTATIYGKLNLVQNLMCFAEAETDPAQRKNFSPLLQSCFSGEYNASNSEENNFNPVSWQEIRTLKHYPAQNR